MEQNQTTVPERHSRIWKQIRIIGWSLAVLILLVPLIAMQFTSEVNWTWSDFVAAGIIIGSIGLLYELAIRSNRSNTYRAAVLVGLAGMFLLLWSNAAVGFVGSGANAANVMYFMMVLVPVIGGIASGFSARGMARIMFIMAGLQALVTAFAFISGLVREDAGFIILATNVFFISLWSASGALFSKSTTDQN